MSGTIQCPACAGTVSKQAAACPHCGDPLTDLKEALQRIENERAAALAEQAAVKKKEQQRIQTRKKIKGYALALVLLICFFSFANYLESERQNDAWVGHEVEILADLNALIEEKAWAEAGKILESFSRIEDNRLDELRASVDAELDRIREKERQAAEVERAQKAAEAERRREVEKVQAAKQREAEQAAATAREHARAEAEAKEESERKRKGFHCLSSWDGSHSGVVKYVEERLREPDSFEHISTQVAPVSPKGEHVLIMEYRARNGFGGMNVGKVLASYSNATCAATIHEMTS